MAGEKLQKILANQGLGSRRAMEKLISEGRVQVNGNRAVLGDRASEADKVEVDGKTIKQEARAVRVILYNKPEGQVCTRSDEKGRPTVFSNLPRLANQRWVNVGRLDINTSGLLLFATDGQLANKLMHPSSNIDREYLVRVFGEVTQKHLTNLREGVELEDGPARFTDIVENESDGSQNKWFTVCLMEGRNREVRRLWESQELKVSRLKRVRYGPVFLPSYVRPGQWADLKEDEIRALYKRCDLAVPKLALAKGSDKKKAIRQESKLRARGR